MSEVQLILIGIDHEVGLFHQFLQIEIGTNRFVVDESGADFFIFLQPELFSCHRHSNFLLMDRLLQIRRAILPFLIVVEHSLLLPFGLGRSGRYHIVYLVCFDIQLFSVLLGSSIILTVFNFGSILQVDVVKLAFRGLESSQIHLGPHPLPLLVFHLLLLQWVLFFLRFLSLFPLVLALHPLLVLIVHEFDILVVLDGLPFGLRLVIADLNSVFLLGQIFVPI